jgi:hypothetical protein
VAKKPIVDQVCGARLAQYGGKPPEGSGSPKRSIRIEFWVVQNGGNGPGSHGTAKVPKWVEHRARRAGELVVRALARVWTA